MDSSQPIKKKPGRWKKGETGNPGGRPRTNPGTRHMLAAAPNVVRVYLEAMKAMTSDGKPDHDTRIKGADRIADRIWGKTPVPLCGPDGERLFAGGEALLALLEKLATPLAVASGAIDAEPIEGEADPLPALAEMADGS